MRRFSSAWDFNFGFGNADYYNASVTSGWQSEHPADYWSTPFWWARFKEDPEYFNLLVDSWEAYRNTILSDNRVNEVIDSLTTMLADAQVRNFNAFPILDSYVWPNNYVGGSYENEIAYLKDWIAGRMEWIDSKLDFHKFPYSTRTHDLANMDLRIFPNPVENEFRLHLNVDWASGLRIEVYNMLAQRMYQADFDLFNGSQTLYFGADMVQQAMPQPGIYYLNLTVDGKFVGAMKVVKQ